MCKMLLSAGANPSLQNKTGFTSLHVTARAGHKDVVVLLLSAGTRDIDNGIIGADPNIRDKFGNNASFWAKEFGHDTLLPLLPKPASITVSELYEYKQQVKGVLGLDKKKKGKKGKKGKKK